MPEVRAQCPLCDYAGVLGYAFFRRTSASLGRAEQEALARVGQHVWARHSRARTQEDFDQVMARVTFSNDYP